MNDFEKNDKQQTYLQLFKKKIYLGILIVLGCAMLGSVLGARKESTEPLPGITDAESAVAYTANDTTKYTADITAESTTDMLSEKAADAPVLLGEIALASTQNKWYNFRYAAVFAIIGVLLYGVIVAIYVPLYEKAFFVSLRKFLYHNPCKVQDQADEPAEYNLFIKP